MPTPLAVSLAQVDRPVRSLLDVAATWQVDGVQLDTRQQVRPDEFGQTARRQLRHALDERRLSLASLVVPTRSPLADASRLDERIAAVLAAMPLAWELGCASVTVRLGAWPGDEAGEERLRRVVAELAAASDRLGPRLTLLPSPGSVAKLAALVDAIEGPVAVQLDPAATVQGGESLDDAARSLADAITHLRLRDAQQDTGETVLGRGQVDWTLAAALSFELPSLRWLVVDRTEGSQRSVDLQNGVAFARRVFTH